MYKRIFAAAIAVLLALSLTACGLSSGSKEAEVGQRLRGKWFFLTVEAATETQAYGDYTATADNKLVDVTLTLESILDEGLPMWSDDFLLNDPADTERYVLCLDQEDVGGEAMPGDYTLRAKEKVTYHLIYEVPSTSSDFSLHYKDLMENGSEEVIVGRVFDIQLGF